MEVDSDVAKAKSSCRARRFGSLVVSVRLLVAFLNEPLIVELDQSRVAAVERALADSRSGIIAPGQLTVR